MFTRVLQAFGPSSTQSRRQPFAYHFLLAIGIYAVSYIPVLLPVGVLAVCLLCSLIFLLKKHFYLSAVLIGIVYGGIYANYLIKQQWPQAFNNQRFIVQGYITGLPKSDETTQRFHLKLDSISTLEGKRLPDLSTRFAGRKIALSWRQYSRSSKEQVPLVKAGDRWQFEVKLRRPRGFVNPAGFDYQLYLLQQKLMASAYVRGSPHNQFLGNRCHAFSAHCWRQDLKQYLTSQFANNKQLGLLQGLLIGDRQGITTQQWERLKNTGTIHLLAISGLHIGLAAWMGFLFGRLLMRLWQLAGHALASLFGVLFNMSGLKSQGRYLAPLFSIVFALFYGLLAGLSLPTQRALIMVVIFHVLHFFYRASNPWLLLSWALFFIALFQPLAIRSQGFWLSFLAVATLLLVFNNYIQLQPVNSAYISKVKQGVYALVKAQAFITIGLFLPSVLLVKGLSLSSPLANFIAVPLVSFVTVPLLLVGLIVLLVWPAAAAFLFSLAAYSLDYLFIYLNWLEAYIGGFWVFNLGEPSTLGIVLATIGLIYFLLPKSIPFKYLGLICCLPIFFSQKVAAPLSLTFLEVGQGTAVVVTTPQHQLVYDTGRLFSPRFDSGRDIVAPYLLQQGHNEIDVLITSHGDHDHAGGVEGLLALVSSAGRLSGEPGKTGGQQCSAGQHWQWDGVSFSVLWPTQDFLQKDSASFNSNNASCVLLIEYGQYRFLLTGDIEKQVEKHLLALYPDKLAKLTAVLVPHHGSRSSSHRGWVEHVQAQYAVITAAYQNAYKHPHLDVVTRYLNVGTRLGHTGRDGAISIAINKGDTLDLQRWREHKRRYWYDQFLD